MAEYRYEYRHPTELYEILKKEKKARAWMFQGRVRTVAIGTSYFKSAFANGPELETLSREYRAVGGKGAPSSWGDVYHRFFKSPRSHGGIRHHLSGRVSAGWQEARKTGPLLGDWNVYDIVSAYGWAARSSPGLPCLASGYPSRSPRPGGIYRVSFREARGPFPPALRSGSLVTGDELENLDPVGLQIENGVAFSRFVDLRKNLDFIRERFTEWKRIWRAFWGAWISTTPITCQIWEEGHCVKSWESTRPLYNPAWAQTITSRVRCRVGEHAARAAHIFVDSVMVPYEIRTGTKPGDWSFVKTIRRPVVLGAGRYGTQEKGQPLRYIKQSGIKKLSHVSM